MPARYIKYYPTIRKKRINYSVLFTFEDKAKMEYNRNMKFRKFVSEWHADEPELMGWSLLDFYTAFVRGGYQLKISF
jgi:hypothetical protein